jgi:O-antigen/teichoic acid export membrane protein
MLQIGMVLFYRFYCMAKFKETHYEFTFDKKILRAVGGFSGWSLFAGGSIALNGQGTTILTNMFFSPVVVTAQTVAGLVGSATTQLAHNFRGAANPQIVKRYAAGNYAASKQLLLLSTKYTFYLMFLLALPVILLAEPLLRLWLGQVPEYSVIFLQLIMVQSLFSVFDSSFYTALYAKGQLRENALISPTLGFIQFPIIYILFRTGHSPVVYGYAGIIVYALLGLVIKPILLCKIVNYTAREIFDTFATCFKVVIASVWLPLLCAWLVKDEVWNFLLVCVASVISIGLSVYFIGMSARVRQRIKDYALGVLQKQWKRNR